jgi:DNA-binding beta-propeller fold protein YncE
MGLVLNCHIELPAHRQKGGFDHAAIHDATGQLFVAHTANDAVDVINCRSNRFSHSIPNVPEVAGVLVSTEHDLVFTSNRSENAVSIFSPRSSAQIAKIEVGIRPNGLAYDPTTGILLSANLGDAAVGDTASVTLVNVRDCFVIAQIPMPGRTRWAIFDPATACFYVNITQPSGIAVIEAKRPQCIARRLEIPVAGAHGLDVDSSFKRLFCACDGGEIVTLDAESGRVAGRAQISGIPDVVFFNHAKRRLYVAVANPGVVDVIDTGAMARVEVVVTERGAKTTAFDAINNRLFVLMPETHRAAVYYDS